MARDKMFDPGFQKAFTEAIHKENKIRMKWHLEFASRMAPSATWDDDDDDEEEEEEQAPSKKEVEEKKKKEEVKVKEEVKKKEKKVEIKKKDEEPNWPPVSGSGTGGIVRVADPPTLMKPVPVKTRLLLYEGVSHDGEGRAQYLKTRKRKDPEQKYYFPVCSSWEYGWKYGQEMEELTCSDYGRHNIIKESFYRPNDPQLKPREDDYY